MAMVEESALSSGRARARRRGETRSRLRRALQPLFLFVLILLVLPFVLLPLYAIVNPPFGTVMFQKALSGAGIEKEWVDLDQISPHVVRAVMASEDARFCSHHGIDWVEVGNALDDDDGKMRGASTITMQTVKNLFLWANHSWLRKGLEAPLALYADLVLSKRRIMEIYLNVVQWDTGIYGVAAASKRNFGMPPAKLSATQAALLAAVLPAPDIRDAAKPGRGTVRIARRIAARAAQLGPAAACVFE